MKWHSSVLIPFITLKCNFLCEYCITRFAPDYNFDYEELTPDKWIPFLSSTHGITDIIFNGGEPTHYPHFHDIINSLSLLKLLAIGTNYSNQATSVLLNIHNRSDLILDGSFHPHFISHRDISQNLLRLKAAGFKVRVHALNYPQFKDRPRTWIHDFKIQGIDAFLQQFEGSPPTHHFPMESKRSPCGLHEKTRVKCTRSIYTPIAPDGTIYFCHYLMYSQNPHGRLGHISDNQIIFPDSLICPHYGWCSPCDWPRKAWHLSANGLKPLDRA